MNKITIVTLFLSISAMLSCSKKEDAKPNILLIMADDMRTEIHSFGIDRAVTPNLDRLSSMGVMFTRAYCQQAICAASRASMLTGLRPDVTGCDYPYSQYFVDELLPDHPSVFTFFHEQGYHLKTMGKLHHGYLDQVQTNHEEFWTEEYYDPANQDIYDNTPGRRKEKVAKLLPFELADLPDSVYADGRMGNAAVDFIRHYANNGNEKPFFLGVGFYKPHAPFVAPARYAQEYDLEEIELSPTHEQLPELKYSIPYRSTLSRYLLEDGVPGRSGLEGYDCSRQRAKEVIRAYLACVSFIDAQVGKIIDALDESGQLDNTIIVFTSDHGYHLGDHGHWGKVTNYEVSALTPLIVADPRLPKKGVTCNALVELIDVYPTLADLAGLKPPGFVEGISIQSLLDQPSQPWKTAAFSQYPWGAGVEGYSIRTNDYRYTEWREKEGVMVGELLAAELYNEAEDPYETINLVDSLQFQDVRNNLKELLWEGWKNALPDGVETTANNPIAPVTAPWQGNN